VTPTLAGYGLTHYYWNQIYRKAALKLVQDLGEDALPEPKQPVASATLDTTSRTDIPSSITPETATSSLEPTSDTQEPMPNNTPSELINTIESQEPPSLPSPDDPVSDPAEPIPPNPTLNSDRKPVTTKERKPMHIPSSVHVRITSDNLKEYVGPPVYQKDRMYAHAPPPGVSTGLGYLGNGSGAVMPIEAMVCPFSLL
jgi:Lon-like ATP-dependent protease